MSTDFGQWDRVASELRAYREAQQQAWGNIDNATLGRYLAGDVTAEERQRIETELHQHPELRKLTDLVSDVVRDCEPVTSPQLARPSVLPFPAAKPAPNTTVRRWRQWVAVAAAACLLLVLGYTVLPKSADPSSPFPRGGLAAVTNTAAFHPSLPPADSPRAGRIQFTAKDAADKVAVQPTTPIDHVAVVLADGCARAGETYQKAGDLDLAEFSYKLAYNLREWKYGAEAPPTVEMRRNLGDVYETALNLNEAVAPPAIASPPATAVGFADKKSEREMQFSAALLRDRLAQQPVAVRKSVVPVLVANLNEAKTPEAREQLGRALANLGGAAKDAVPALDAYLQNRDLTAKERAAVTEAKKRLEKADWPAGVEDAPVAAPAPPP